LAREWLRWRWSWLAAGVLAACGLLTAVGRLRLLADPDGPAAIVLRRGGPSSAFWTHTTWGKTFHEVQPWEFLVVMVPLTLLFIPLDWWGLWPQAQAKDFASDRA
jgi:hypothetical protein